MVQSDSISREIFFGVAVFDKIIIGFLHDQNTQTNTP